MYETLRTVFIAFAALAVNAAIFSTIAYMVERDKVRLTDAASPDLANFIRVDEDTREVRSRRAPKAPEKPQSELNKTIQSMREAAGSGGPGDLAFDVPNMNINTGLDMGSDISIARELTPLVRIPPDYPGRAMAKRIEGYVLLRFEVTETGSVANPEVLRSDPPGLFDRAAKRAVLRWKYQPQIREGEARRVMTLTRLTFKLAEQDTMPGS